MIAGEETYYSIMDHYVAHDRVNSCNQTHCFPLMVLDYQKVKEEVLPTCIRSFNRWFSPDMWVIMTDPTGMVSL